MLHYITTMMTSIFIIWELEPSSPFCFWRFGLHLGFSFRHTLGFAQMDCAKIFDFCKNFILYFLSNLGFDLAYQPSLPKCWSKCESISSLEPFHWIFGFGTCHLCALFYFQHFSFKDNWKTCSYIVPIPMSISNLVQGLNNWSKNSIKVSISNPSSCHPTIDASFYKK